MGARGVACCGRRGTSSGVLGRPEVAGGGWQGAATVRERTVARSRAPKWLGMPFSKQCGRRQVCLAGLGGSKEKDLGLGCFGWLVGEERGRRRVELGLSRIENWWFHPLNH